MAKDTGAKATPAKPAPALKKQNSSSTKQSSILGFFSKGPASIGSTAKKPANDSSGTPINGTPKAQISTVTKQPAFKKTIARNPTPVPSSDAAAPSSQENGETDEVEDIGLPSPMTPAKRNVKQDINGVAFSSPSRKTKKIISYAESDDEDEGILPTKKATRKAPSRRRVVVESDEDDFGQELDGTLDDDIDEDMDDFVVEDDSDAPVRSKKRKRPAAASSSSRKNSRVSLPPPTSDEDDMEIPETSTAQQWRYDANASQPLQPRSSNAVKKPARVAAGQKLKDKPRDSAPEKRYTWLAHELDMDRNPPDHPDYDKRTLFIPQMAFNNFSPFEKQYWEIKQKWWDTIVFFKKGKFYELYEKDAMIGHQLFDLKLTDRVNMSMVGVPEASLDHWANQFVAKGYKIARVDQMESALGKEMREREDSVPMAKGKAGKADKIIRRELACVLTRGTLVEGSMLQDDMSTYCVAIKEGVVNDLPAFGIAFVDTATGQFFLSEFVDDIDLTKFETFVAQCRPEELLLEKSCISVKALRILKNNTSPTTIWNYLKPGKEFWDADSTVREIEGSGYFLSDDLGGKEVWPEVLASGRERQFLMSAFGALVQYLRTLKLERALLSQANFSRYDPIQKATTLVLDGQTLINLEVFANTFDGGSEGTLFTLLNRCTTPFGKRTFRQWVCHPLADAVRINQRLDAVDTLNQDRSLKDQFISSMTRMPDLERLISRIHAKVCKVEDFVRVLEGFEHIEYTMSLLGAFSGGGGLIDQLISAMPDLSIPLAFWKTAFDREKAKGAKPLLIPEPGIEQEFDDSQTRVEDILKELQELLRKYQKQWGSSVCFRDVGKEIYQIEVPVTFSKSVPKNWDQISATKAVKRYYFPELKGLVRELQEAQESHGQIVREVAGRFFTRFDNDYKTWQNAIKIIAQLDCLISLAEASSSLGQPSCRPTFVDSERSVLDFEELRHPCMLPNVTDFIPNDVKLGGNTANINLLTGANAAGKSTILRMTCTAVIMAQIGCYVPCISARMTPVDRIMSRLGANDNIFAAQSTFFVELSETKKILSEATPHSLVILDELGRGTSSYDGVAVAQAVLHHVATHIGCIGFFATHYHSLATEFDNHPEIAPKRMQIYVDDEHRKITFLYKLEHGVAEGSFGMHCASMCGIPKKVVDRAEQAAKDWEHTSRLKESLEKAKSACYVPLGVQSDVAWLLREGLSADGGVEERGMKVLMEAIKSL